MHCGWDLCAVRAPSFDIDHSLWYLAYFNMTSDYILTFPCTENCIIFPIPIKMYSENFLE